MKDNRLKGIIALAIVTVVSFGLIYGSKQFTKDDNKDNGKVADKPVEGAIDVAGQEGIKAAREVKDDTGALTGYVVTAGKRGFAGEIVMDITFDKDAKTITEMKLISHSETEGYGKKMEEGDYLKQFEGIVPPVRLVGGEGEGTEIDAVSGATVTSNALVTLTNNAYAFISNYAGK